MLNDLIVLSVITFLVRFVGVVAGGGAIILLPLMIALGLSPSQAIATNRMSILGMHTTLIKFHKHRQVKWKIALYILIPSLIGTVIGTLLVVQIDQELFKKIIGIVFFMAIPLLLYNKDLGIKERKLTKKMLQFGIPFSLVAGFLSAMFGMTGIWFSYVFLFLGLTFVQSIATRKFIGLINASVSILIFLPSGLIDWPIAITMLISGMLGSWLSAHFVVKTSNKWLKVVFAVVAVLIILKVLIF